MKNRATSAIYVLEFLIVTSLFAQDVILDQEYVHFLNVEPALPFDQFYKDRTRTTFNEIESLLPITKAFLSPIEKQTDLPNELAAFFDFGQKLEESNSVCVGIDIPAEEKLPVRAVADGTIVEADYDIGLGLYNVIDHGNGLHTVYGHLGLVRYPAGAKISAGTIIGFTGNSGYSSFPHLFFAIKYNGAYLNPRYYMGSFWWTSKK